MEIPDPAQLKKKKKPWVNLKEIYFQYGQKTII